MAKNENKNDQTELTEGAATTGETKKNEKPAQKNGEKDSFEDMVEMVVPRKPKGEEQQYYVCVNDRRYGIPANGKMQKLPRPVAEILQESLNAEYAADEFAESIPNRDPIEQNNKLAEQIQELQEQIRQLQMQ